MDATKLPKLASEARPSPRKALHKRSDLVANVYKTRSVPTIAVQNLEDNLTSTVIDTPVNQEMIEHRSIKEESREDSPSPEQSFGVQYTEETMESPFKASKPLRLNELTGYRTKVQVRSPRNYPPAQATAVG